MKSRKECFQDWKQTSNRWSYIHTFSVHCGCMQPGLLRMEQSCGFIHCSIHFLWDDTMIVSDCSDGSVASSRRDIAWLRNQPVKAHGLGIGWSGKTGTIGKCQNPVEENGKVTNLSQPQLLMHWIESWSHISMVCKWSEWWVLDKIKKHSEECQRVPVMHVECQWSAWSPRRTSRIWGTRCQMWVQRCHRKLSKTQISKISYWSHDFK